MQKKKAVLKRYLLALFLVFGLGTSQAQQDQTLVLDTSKTSISTLIKAGQFHVYARNFFMSTFNEGQLKDDYAMASGAGLRFLTKNWKGFEAGMSGYFIFRIAASGIENPDPATGQNNRYEMGLFDIQNPKNTSNLDRLEELYLRYKWGKYNHLEFGRIHINTPFVNPQHGRMRPTLQKGAWFRIAENQKKVQLHGGYIFGVSPRSTVEWFSMSETIGLYPSGVDVFGKKSNYAGNIESHGLALLHGQLNLEKAKFHVWNGYLENIMNTAICEVFLFQQKDKKAYLPKIQIAYFHQNAIADGGNADPTKTYIQKGAQSNAISLRIENKVPESDIFWQVNFTHITKDGRYLMPREYGKDWFYTFLPRERNEGLGGVDAVMVKVGAENKTKRYSGHLAYGYYHLPDVKDFRLNKYGMPSYHQINIEGNLALKGFFENFTLRALIAAKLKAGETYDNPKYVYNKVDMLNFNLILDYLL